MRHNDMVFRRAQRRLWSVNKGFYVFASGGAIEAYMII